VNRRPLRDDTGSTLPLIVGFAALALAVALLLAAASSLYLERKRLLDLADESALAAAESFDLDDVRVDGLTVRPRLTSAEVRDAVAAHLASRSGIADDVAVAQAESTDGMTATVTLSSVWNPPFVSMLIPTGVAIDATATARSVFR
jgi:hypothetical protein